MASRPIEPSELLSPRDYEKVRRGVVAEIIKLKTRRRIEIGPWVSIVFENRRTVLYQIQEMVRIERLTEPLAIRHEIETYADLIPKPGELSPTFFIEISDPDQRRDALAGLGGIEKAFALKLGAEAIPAFDKRPIDPQFERPGQATAVYYLGFRLTPAQRELFISSKGEAWLTLSHPKYGHAAAL